MKLTKRQAKREDVSEVGCVWGGGDFRAGTAQSITVTSDKKIPRQHDSIFHSSVPIVGMVFRLCKNYVKKGNPLVAVNKGIRMTAPVKKCLVFRRYQII